MKKANESNYVTRPKGKPEVTTKGKMNEWSNGYREFIPQGTRENNRQMLKQLGDSSFYKTEGKKESSYSLHLNVDGASQDPVGEMFEQFKMLTAGQQKEKPALSQENDGRMLFDNGSSLKIWLDTTHGKLCILAELNCGPDVERQLLQAQGQMNVTIGRYRTDIINSNNQ
ncbi:MAG: hypothetical protein IKP16_08435 [Prevotella sp.]|nr:hypothetical protein [Prevotella sp.]